MSRTRYLLGRLAFVVFAAYGLLSVTFFFVALTPDPNEAFVAMAAAMGGGDTESAIAGYRAARNRDVPLLTRYVGWLVSYSTLDWGTARGLTREPVLGLIADAVPKTLAYVVPGVVFAAGGGVAIGVWNALRPRSLFGRAAAIVAIVAGAVPSYWLGYLLAMQAVTRFELLRFYRWNETATFAGTNLPNIFLASVTIASILLAVQLRYVRSSTAEFLRTEAAKLVRMKGGRDRDVIRHGLRLFGASMLTLFLTEALTVLFLGIYVVETVFKIPGFGQLSLDAIQRRDVPVILGTTFVPILLGLAATFLQDLVETSLDPRIE